MSFIEVEGLCCPYCQVRIRGLSGASQDANGEWVETPPEGESYSVCSKCRRIYMLCCMDGRLSARQLTEEESRQLVKEAAQGKELYEALSLAGAVLDYCYQEKPQGGGLEA